MKILNYSLLELKTNGKYYLVAGICLIGVLSSFMVALPKNIFQSEFTQSSLRLGIVIPEDSFFRDMIKTSIGSNESVNEVKIIDRNQIQTLLKHSEIDLVIELPDNVDEIMFNKEQGIINLYANNPLIGKIMYQILKSAVTTVNVMQLTSLDYYEQIIKSSLTQKQKQLNIEKFDEQLIEKVITRAQLTKIHNYGSQYVVQLWSLTYFFIVVIFSIFNVQIYAKRKKTNILKKLVFYRFTIKEILLVKLILQQLIVLVSASLVYWLFRNFSEIEFWKYLLVLQCLSFFTLALFYAIYTIGLNYRSEFSVLLVLSSLSLVFLFLGGLIFPLYDFDLAINYLNPAWYVQMCVSYMLANQLNLSFLSNLCIFASLLSLLVYVREAKR
ncbi:ABC transporter permease [uncultured Enterococcus sp.]|uniref:ABC transporter permease n=1 Tax=uncultured Enterococcus sp. TaxID=167972 RepID=UPI0025CEC089|nr:ABC transporter permease [uncultured Enterococcus sp.]